LDETPPLALVRRKRTLTPGEIRQRRRARVTTGLQARTQIGNGYRERKVGHLLRKVVNFCAENNRPLDELQIPAARRWCRLSLLNQLAYEEIAKSLAAGQTFGDISSKTLEVFFDSSGGAAREEAALGWSANSRSQLLRNLAGAARDRQAAQAQAELARYAPRIKASG